MVCFYHTGRLNGRPVTEAFWVPNFDKLVLNVCAMSVPLFFMVNGALMLRKCYSWKQILCRAVKIYFLYYFWMIIISEIGTVFFEADRLTVMGLLTGKRNAVSVHLWFLSTIAVLTLMTPVLKRMYDSKARKVLYGGMGLLFLFPFTYNYVVLAMNWFHTAHADKVFVTGAATMYAILYFLLGKLISDKSKNENRCDRKDLVFAVGSLILGWCLVTLEVTLWTNLLGYVYDGVNSSFPTIGALLMAVGTFYILSKAAAPKNLVFSKLIDYFSEHIMGIYIFHHVILRIVLKVVPGGGSVLKNSILTLGIMLISAVITDFMKRIPLLRKLVNL